MSISFQVENPALARLDLQMQPSNRLEQPSQMGRIGSESFLNMEVT